MELCKYRRRVKKAGKVCDLRFSSTGHFVLCLVLVLTVGVPELSAAQYTLEFDGVDDYVNVLHHSSLNPSAVTVMAWVNPFTTSGNRNVVFKGDHQYAMQLREGKILFGSKSSVGAYSEFLGSLVVSANTWTHVAITHDGSIRKLYVNGVLDPITSSQSGLFTGDTNPLRIGIHYSLFEPFDGIIDEVAIYNRALAAEEIVASTFGQLTGNEPNLVGYWDFDEGGGQIAYDLSGNGNDGYLGSDPNAVDASDPTWVASDLMNSIQPDLLIRTDDELLYTGDDVYNDLAAQTKSQTAAVGMTVVYDIKLQNDRVAVDGFIVTGTGGSGDWSVSYYDISSGTDITSDVTGAGWSSPVLPPSGGYVELTLEITPEPNILDGSVLEELVTAMSLSDPNKADTVKAVTTFLLSAPAPPWSGIYTTNEDFDRGTLVGVEHDTVADQLQLSVEATTLPFIWVPNSSEGTVSKVDTRTGKELGRYRTGPTGNGNPSRTTVDLFGNCWVGNRNTGTVVKIGLLENGQYMDRNYNNIIETSRDLNGDGDITGDEILPWASDECVIYEVVLIPGSEGTYIPGQYQGTYANDYWNPGPRGIAVDAYNNIWAGAGGTMKYYYIDGQTGEILKTVDVSPWNHNPYGAVIDEYGVLWSSDHGGGSLSLELDDIWLDPSTDPPTIGRWNPGHFVYGIGLDYLGHLFAVGWEPGELSRINILTGATDWTKPGSYQARGVACTSDNDVWVASTGNDKVYRYDNDGNLKADIYVGDGPTGVAVDAAGKVWSCNLNDEYITRIDPNTNTVDLSKRIIGSGGHYTYSDMTGIVSRTATTRIGSWTVIHNTRAFDAPWGVISWNSSEPRGTSLKVKVRSSNDRRKWSLWGQALNYAALRNTPNGRYLEVKATFQSTTEGTSPILYDLAVNPSPACGDLEHPYPQSDVNRDCRVDFTDFVFMAAEWLNCTAPECN